jgi:tRNA(Leu) C34 or U34 (ribose-2'-O)-methylase TrmL
MVHLSGYTARPPHPRVKRAAQDAQNLITWKAWPDARPAVAWLKERGFMLVGLEPSAAACDFREYDYSWPLCVVVGNEALGIAPALGKQLDGLIRIPMHGGKSSLNVVVALGIILYHIVTHPVRPSREVGEGDRISPEATFSSIVHRAVSSPRVEAVWRAHSPRTPGLPALVLLLEAPALPHCEVWALPGFGGVLLQINQEMEEPESSSVQSPRWIRLDSGQSARKCTCRLSSALPSGQRGSVLGAEMALSRAWHAMPPFQRLALDSFLFSVLEQHDPEGKLAPYVTRYVGAEHLREMQSLAKLILHEISRPLGGPWRDNEILIVPDEVARHDLLDRVSRHILFGAP